MDETENSAERSPRAAVLGAAAAPAAVAARRLRLKGVAHARTGVILVEGVMRRVMVTAVVCGLVFAGSAHAAGAPRYDVPAGFTRCPHATAWHGFFKWSSARHASCRDAARFVRRYASHADGGVMPRRVAGYACRIRYWRNEDGDIYASRHVCARGRVTIRFYGMV